MTGIKIKIVKRAEELNLLTFDRLTLLMDLDCANDEFNLNLEELYNADDFNFAHDIYGIQNNINRTTKKMGNLFVPRFANNQ